jgi:serine phosphatase RsbU (regulator of sigma subunit)
MSPRKELGGALLARLPWAFGGFGLLLTLAAGSLVERLLRRREHAESLAHENASLYAEQRSVAQTLQHSLLPATLPQVEGLTLATRYVAGVKGIDIGGDWYDVVSLDNGQLLFVVGDVSGRGLRAATTMAELRYAIRAYAAQGDPPAAILTKISRLIDVGRGGEFATVLCGTIDVPARRVVLANAGHPDLLVIAANEAWYAASSIGAPVGVAGGRPYAEVTVTVPPNATLLAYTDGLIERRGEQLDVGLERLRNAALHHRGSIEDLLANVLARTRQTEAADDTAILGLRWDN